MFMSWSRRRLAGFSPPGGPPDVVLGGRAQRQPRRSLPRRLQTAPVGNLAASGSLPSPGAPETGCDTTSQTAPERHPRHSHGVRASSPTPDTMTEYSPMPHHVMPPRALAAAFAERHSCPSTIQRNPLSPARMPASPRTDATVMARGHARAGRGAPTLTCRPARTRRVPGRDACRRALTWTLVSHAEADGAPQSSVNAAATPAIRPERDRVAS